MGQQPGSGAAGARPYHNVVIRYVRAESLLGPGRERQGTCVVVERNPQTIVGKPAERVRRRSRDPWALAMENTSTIRAKEV